MNNKQVAAGREALFPYADRVKLDISNDGTTWTLTPYITASPEQRGEPVEVVKDGTQPADVTRTLKASIEGLLA
jgi:hypothetical protein